MAWTAPVDPVGGTVITVAYAVQNMRAGCVYDGGGHWKTTPLLWPAPSR